MSNRINRIKGVPLSSNNWWLQSRENSKFILFENHIGIEFSIHVPIEHECEYLQTVETMLGMMINSPVDIHFGFDMADDREEIYVVLYRNNLECGRIGQVPWMVSMVIRSMYKEIIESGALESEKFEIECSMVARNISPSKIMDVSDMVDDLSEVEFDDTVKNLENFLSSPIYNVKIGLKIEKNNSHKVAGLLGGRKCQDLTA